VTSLAVTFVTGNAGKVKTAREHLAPLGIEVEQARLDLDEIQSLHVQDVAMHKAQQAFRALGRPLIIEDSGFGIDELDGYPGPMIKHALTALGARGIARLADLTATRACRFSSCLVYIDDHGVPRVFASPGRTCTVAAEPAEPLAEGAWSDLWNVVIPEGGSAPLSALPPAEAERETARWKQESIFRQFGEWLRGKATAVTGADGRMRSRELSFDFPADRIAVRPGPAGTDRLLVVDRASGAVSHRMFSELPGILPPRSLLVVNNSAVVRAALRRVPDDGTYLHITSPFRPELSGVEVLCPWKPRTGTSIAIRGGRFLVQDAPEPGRDLRLGAIVADDPAITTLAAFMRQHGEVPIPIYVNARRDPDAADAADYQNVYASVPGSVACATAGLHLTEPVIKALREGGHDIAEVTLHIGYGTWKSLAAEFVDQHVMDAETCEIPAAALSQIRAAKHAGRPVVAVGTSAVRTLETFAGQILTGTGEEALRCETGLYIAPGFGFRVTEHMITNFAYPQTPIMAMTAAFAGSFALLRAAYQGAADDGRYQFLTYGDAMLLR
jgi:S-adenosylmethionine:tRNA ribosyltransferase-isomerase/non-canonical purine NTP pyrophosphatase (RdgB/HAM1 family)